MSESTNNHSASEGAFQWSFLGPRYWGTWLLLGILRLMTVTPRSWVMRLGALLGDAFRRYNHKRRRIVEVNLELCFPDLTAQQRQQLLVDHFRAHGRSVLDTGLSLWGSEEQIRQLVDLDGFDAYQQRVADGPVLAITWHLTTMELTGVVMGLAGPTVSMMKPLGNPLLTWIIRRGRSHLCDVLLLNRDAGMRPLVRGMRAGRQCILLPDEDFGNRGAEVVFVPFFGVPRAMVTTPGRIAKVTGAAVVVCAGRLDPASGRYRCTFSPPLESVKGNDPEADAAAICSAMESLIAQAPEQYLWTFRWFQSRPDGAPSPYDPVP